MHIESYQGLKNPRKSKHNIVGLFPLGSCVINSRCRLELYNVLAQVEVKAVGLFFLILILYFTFFIFHLDIVEHSFIILLLQTPILRTKAAVARCGRRS